MSSSKRRIGVVGAGVVGLCTAVQIQAALPSSQVTVIAEKFNQETTSDGAAGIFQPNGEIVRGVQLDLLKQWTKDSFEFYNELAHSPEAADAGIGIISAFHFFLDSEPEEDPIYKDFIYEYRDCTEAEHKIFPHTDKAQIKTDAVLGLPADAIKHLCGPIHDLNSGRKMVSTLAHEESDAREEGDRRFVKAGKVVAIDDERVWKMELVRRFDIVVNCTGLGSFELLGDKEMVPNRGQVIRVKAPWLKHSLMIDKDVYIIPGRDTVVVGGTRQQGDGDLNVRAKDRDHIWATACKYVPSLKEAKWEWEWVGLRPYRSPLRLEREIFQFQSGSLPVVHNYGHSGEGMGLAWGTGKHACRLVCELVTESSPAVAKL